MIGVVEAHSSDPTIDEVKRILRSLIAENAGIPSASIRDDSAVDRDLAMDSLSFLSVQTAVEEHFGIACDVLEIEGRNRFDAIAALVLERVQGRSRRRVSGAA